MSPMVKVSTTVKIQKNILNFKLKYPHNKHYAPSLSTNSNILFGNRHIRHTKQRYLGVNMRLTAVDVGMIIILY